MEKCKESKYSCYFDIDGKPMSYHVITGNIRVIEKESFKSLFCFLRNTELGEILRKGVFTDNFLIEFYCPKINKKLYGYSAENFIEKMFFIRFVCVPTQNNRFLKEETLECYNISKKVISVIAKTGLEALIDEATGYK